SSDSGCARTPRAAADPDASPSACSRGGTPMIDLDLINQTENIATGTHLPWWMLIVCVAALIAVPAAGLGKYPLDMKLHELLLFEQKWGSLRSADDIQDAINKNKNLTKGPHPSALASL